MPNRLAGRHDLNIRVLNRAVGVDSPGDLRCVAEHVPIIRSQAALYLGRRSYDTPEEPLRCEVPCDRLALNQLSDDRFRIGACAFRVRMPYRSLGTNGCADVAAA